MLVMTLPMVVGLAVFQINALLDTLIAFGLSPSAEGQSTFKWWGRTIAYPIETGSVAALAWAQRLYQFPLGVFGIAVATAIYPALARAARSGEDGAATPSDDGFIAILRKGLRLTVFIGLPATVGLVLVREPLVRVVYERAAFRADDAMRVSAILLGYATSVWAYSMAQVLTRAFYARGDTLTPVKTAAAMVGLNLCLNLTLIWPLGAAGLAWSTAITAALQAVVLLALLSRREPGLIDRAVRRSWLKTAAAAGAMGLMLWPITHIGLAPLDPQWRLAAALAMWVAFGVASVTGLAWVLRMPELRWVINRGR